MASFSSTYPAQRPVFSLDAANAGRLDPRMTFTRSDTPPTYAAPSAVHYWSNEKHLSSENLITNSEDFSAWTASNTTPTANAVAAPDGTTTADTITGTGTGSLQKSVQSNTISASYPVVSVYVKAGSHNYIQIQSDWSGSHYANFDVTSGAGAVGSLGGNTTATIQAVGSTGWYRCVCRYNAASMSPIIIIRLVDSASAAYGAATTTTGTVHLWGAMATGLGDLTNIVAYQPSTTSIHRQYAPTLKSVATAGQPRFEYDPSTDGQSVAKGILIEGSATNLATYSSDITQSFFSAYQSNRDSNVAIAPDGTLTADLLRDDSSSPNTDHSLYWTYSSGGATPQTISFYAKAAGRTHVKLRFSVTSDGVFPGDDVYFDVQNGAVGTTDSDITASVEDCGNGWFRCIATRTAQASGVGQITLYLANANGSFTYSGDSYSGVLLWGIQIEANASFASSLISSNGSATTRAAESLSMTDSGLFDNGGGTIVAEYDTNNPSAVAGIAAITDGTGSSNAVSLRLQASTAKLFVNNAGSTQAAASTTAPSAGVSQKIAGRYAVNDFGVSVNGGSVVADANGTVPVISKLEIGTMDNGSYHLNGHVKRVAIYPALTDTNLQALTS